MITVDMFVGSFLLFFASSHFLTTAMTTGSQSLTAGPLIITASNAFNISFFNEPLSLDLAILSALNPRSGHALLTGNVAY